MRAEHCFLFSFAKLSFLVWNHFGVVILETEDSHSSQNKWTVFWAQSVFSPLNFLCLLDYQYTNENEWFVLLSGLHSQTQANASLEKIKWNNTAIDYGDSALLRSRLQCLPCLTDCNHSFHVFFLFKLNKLCKLITTYYQTSLLQSNKIKTAWYSDIMCVLLPPSC